MKQKIVIKVFVCCDRCRKKAMKLAAAACGVSSVSLEGDCKDKLAVIGEGVDAAELTRILRKKVNKCATLESIQEVKPPGPQPNPPPSQKPTPTPPCPKPTPTPPCPKPTPIPCCPSRSPPCCPSRSPPCCPSRSCPSRSPPCCPSRSPPCYPSRCELYQVVYDPYPPSACTIQ